MDSDTTALREALEQLDSSPSATTAGLTAWEQVAVDEAYRLVHEVP